MSLSTKELTVFSIIAAIMILPTATAFKIIPNVHMLGLIIAACTLTYRTKALIPLYIYILLEGFFKRFSLSWIPYLYIWLPIWFAFMIVGKIKLPKKIQVPLFMFLCGLHGLAFGTLYAPAHALIYGLNFNGMVAWIIAGLPFDIIHAIGNIAAATLIIPLSVLMIKLSKGQYRQTT